MYGLFLYHVQAKASLQDEINENTSVRHSRIKYVKLENEKGSVLTFSFTLWLISLVR